MYKGALAHVIPPSRHRLLFCDVISICECLSVISNLSQSTFHSSLSGEHLHLIYINHLLSRGTLHYDTGHTILGNLYIFRTQEQGRGVGARGFTLRLRHTTENHLLYTYHHRHRHHHHRSNAIPNVVESKRLDIYHLSSSYTPRRLARAENTYFCLIEIFCVCFILRRVILYFFICVVCVCLWSWFLDLFDWLALLVSSLWHHGVVM